MESALENQKKNAQLASAFAKDHPNSAIRSVEDFYKFIQNNPNVAETWIKTKEDIPVERRGVQELASSFQALDQLEYLENLSQPEQQKPDKNLFKDAFALAASPFALRNNDVKLAKDALTQPTPDVNLYEFIPTEISSDEDFQNHVKEIEGAKIKDLQAKNPNKPLKKTEIQNHLAEEHSATQAHALNQFVGNSAERSEKIRDAREKDLYIKDGNGRIIGEKVFVDKKGKANPYADPVFRTYQEQKRKAIDDALAKRKDELKRGIKQKYSENDLRTMVTYQYDGHFATMFPEKAAAYAKLDDRLDQALKTIQKAEKRIEKQEEKTQKKAEEKRKQEKTNPPVQNQPQRQDDRAWTKNHISVQERLENWNHQVIARARLNGYNPKAVYQKLRDMKIWDSRAWKYGKYAVLGPTVAGGMDLYKWQANRRKSGKTQGSSKLWGGYNKARSQGSSFFNNKLSGFSKGAGNKIGKNPIANKMSSAAKNVGKKLANQALSQVRDKAVAALLENPVSLLIIGIVLLVILAIIMVLIVVVTAMSGGSDSTGAGGLGPSGPGNGSPQPNANPIPGFTINKEVDKAQSTFPDQITYTITYSYAPSSGATIQLSDITIVDVLDKNAVYISSSGNGTLDSSTNTVSWKLSDPQSTSPLTLIIKPAYDNIVVSNTAYATSQATSVANSSNCSGFYSFTQTIDGVTYTNPKGNFADPDCYYASNFEQAKNDVLQQLLQEDPQNAYKWFNQIIPCESSYIPNTYRDHNQIPQTPDPNGAWGLFQIGSTGLNGPFDNGAVPWKEQIHNAVNLLKTQGWGYWGC